MSLPYFPMYPKDFEADTSHLSLEEDGAYNRLLRLMWMTPGCSLPDDDGWLIRRMRVDQDTFERVVLCVVNEFFVQKGGRIHNPRLLKEWERASQAHGARVAAGSKGGKVNARKTKALRQSNAVATPKQPEPEPEPNDIPDGISPPFPPEDAGTQMLPPERAEHAPRKRQTSSGIQDGWVPDQQIAQRLQEELRLTPEELRFCFAQMKDHAHAKGRKLKDWNAGYSQWVRKAANDGEIGPGSRSRRTRSVDSRGAIDDV